MTERAESLKLIGNMYQSRNPPDLATKDENEQAFSEEQDNDDALITPTDNIENVDVTRGDDVGYGCQ
eukprot:8105583-Ditylum_brightwellii.AAC.1